MIVTNSLTGGGAERSMNIISREMHSRNWPVLLVPINSGSDDLIETTCEVARIERRWKSGTLKTFLSYLKFKEIVKEWRPDYVVLNTDLPEFYAALTPGRQINIVVEHSPFAWSTRRLLGRAIRTILSLRGSTEWVAVSSHLTLWGIREARPVVIQNPIDIGNLQNLTRRETDGSIRRIVFIGRLENPPKNPDIALDLAFKSNLPILFLGTGGMLEMLLETAKDLKVDAEFKGFVRDPWIHLTGNDLLVVPSAWEGDGLVVLEALQKGFPILVSDIKDFRRFGLPELNYCKNTIDFASKVDQFKQSIESLIVDPEVVNGILSERSPQKIVDDWERLLQGQK
jgi:glycosyltransferase involved in cell wall biosynthesis